MQRNINVLWCNLESFPSLSRPFLSSLSSVSSWVILAWTSKKKKNPQRWHLHLTFHRGALPLKAGKFSPLSVSSTQMYSDSTCSDRLAVCGELLHISDRCLPVSWDDSCSCSVNAPFLFPTFNADSWTYKPSADRKTWRHTF